MISKKSDRMNNIINPEWKGGNEAGRPLGGGSAGDVQPYSP